MVKRGVEPTHDVYQVSLHLWLAVHHQMESLDPTLHPAHT